MTELKFCAKCGEKRLHWDGEKRWNCTNCNYVLFHNVAGAVAVIIRYQDEILLTRRNQDPQKEKLDLPGGFTDPKESAEETCIRELFEEMQMQVESSALKYLGSLPNTYHYKGIDYNTLDLFFEYSVEEKFSIKAEISEILETLWLKIPDIDLDDIAFESQKVFLAKYKSKSVE